MPSGLNNWDSQISDSKSNYLHYFHKDKCQTPNPLGPFYPSPSPFLNVPHLTDNDFVLFCIIACAHSCSLFIYHWLLSSFQPSLDNIHALVHSFTNSSQARREGLKFQDIVYECVRADRFSVYAKHVSVTGNCGACIDVEDLTRLQVCETCSCTWNFQQILSCNNYAKASSTLTYSVFGP